MTFKKGIVIRAAFLVTVFSTLTGFGYYQENQTGLQQTSPLLAQLILSSGQEPVTVSENTVGPVSDKKTNKEDSIVGKLIVADVTNYVNVRTQPDETSEIAGKLYDKSVGTLLEITGDWYRIESGTTVGFVKAEYVLTGEDAKKRADEVGNRLATVLTTTLKIRSEASTESSVIGLVPEGDILSVTEEQTGWVKVSVEEGEGYVSTEYLEVYTENVKAESVEEERIRLEKEEAERKKAEEAARIALEKKQAASRKKSSSAKSSKSSDTTQKTASAGNTSLGRQIADYALQFVGNPYVYGGTSLTNGADCSGFVMSVYANFGISLPRTSGEQGGSGSNVGSIDNAQAGDLVWYSGHIGIYIGDGRIVHASNKKEGIKTSNAGYRKILGVRRIV